MKRMKFSVYTDYKKYVMVTRDELGFSQGVATLGEGDRFDLITGAQIAALRCVSHVNGPCMSTNNPELACVGEMKVDIDKLIEGVRAIWFELGYASSEPSCPAGLWRILPRLNIDAKLVLTSW